MALPPAEAAPPEVSRLLGFAQYNEKDTDLAFPGPIESLTQDFGGFRTALASVGIGFQGIDIDVGVYNLLDNAHPRSPQQYDGQVPTYAIGTHQWVFTYDTSHIGINGGQIAFSPMYYTSTRSADGIYKLYISFLQYYQSLFHDHVGIKVGYGPMFNQFIGLSGVGGNPTSQTNGVSAYIPVELGLNLYPASGPFATLNIHWADGAYNKIGVSRSLSPVGAAFEERNEGAGLRFGAADAKAVVVEEVGLKRPFSLSEHQIWLRAGMIYNFTDYPSLDGNSAPNWGGYALADYQLTKFDKTSPDRGLFIGGSALYATPQVNSFSSYFEGRIYVIGVLNALPHDVDSLIVGRNVFSQSIRRRLANTGVSTAPSQLAVAYAHTFRVIPGLFVSPSLAYSDHPSFIGRFAGALNAGVSLVVLY